MLRTHCGCLAWGGTAQLSLADDVLISVERLLGVVLSIDSLNIARLTGAPKVQGAGLDSQYATGYQTSTGADLPCVFVEF